MALALIIIGTLLLVATLGYWWWMSANANPADVSLPPQLAGLPLLASSQGPAAVTEINRLHDNRFPINSGAVGRYGNRGEITLWVSGVPLKFMASRMIQAMQDGIAEGNSPFQPVGTRQVGSRDIYELTGMGQRHFYFRSGSLVIWLAANDDFAELALSETLEFYP